MEVVEKNRRRKNLISKTWEVCRSVSSRRHRSRLSLPPMLKSRSWPRSYSDESSSSKRSGGTRCQVVPVGCFAVYVGPQRQRVVMKTKYINHPLFKMLLEEAEVEYGYNSQGPLALPCDVDQFYKVLSEMDCEEARQGCGFAKGYGSYHLLTFSHHLGWWATGHE